MIGPLKKFGRASAKKLVIDAISLIFSRFIQVGSRFLYLVIVARMLGPELYGQLSYSQSWYLVFFQFCMLGLPSVVARAAGRGGEEADRVISGSNGAVFVACTVLAILAGAITWLIESDPAVRLVSTIFSIGVLTRGVAVWIEILLIAYERSRRILLTSLFIRPAEPIFAYILLAYGWGVAGLATVHVSLWALHALIVGIVYLRVKRRITMHFRLPVVIPLLKDGAALWIGGGAIGYLQVGPVIVHKWMDGSDLGILAILTQVVVVLGVVPLSIMQALLPAMSRQVENPAGDSRNLTSVMMSTFLIGGALCSTVAHVVAYPVLLLILGEVYAQSASVLWVSVFTIGIFGAALTMNQLLTAKGRYYQVGIASVVGCAAFFAMGTIEGNPTPFSTMIAASVGYGVWFLVAAIFAGFLIPGLTTATIACLCVIPMIFVEQPLMALITVPILIGYVWATGLLNQIKTLFSIAD
ncbi:MAG: oligosaccharide flippase family protein [Alphaproteobacteria bacterium]|nr:oligosaccharide flippase family protein [Alphaproteobacteria bacterium]